MWSLKDSHCRGTPHLRRITQPALVIQSNADSGVFPSDARAIFDALGSENKHLEIVDGDHYLQVPDTTRGKVADIITDWINSI